MSDKYYGMKELYALPVEVLFLLLPEGVTISRKGEEWTFNHPWEIPKLEHSKSISIKEPLIEFYLLYQGLVSVLPKKFINRQIWINNNMRNG